MSIETRMKMAHLEIKKRYVSKKSTAEFSYKHIYLVPAYVLGGESQNISSTFLPGISFTQLNSIEFLLPT
jgi:hypothetical protein